MDFIINFGETDYTITLPLTQLEYNTIRAYYYANSDDFKKRIGLWLRTCINPQSKLLEYDNAKIVAHEDFQQLHSSVKQCIEYHELWKHETIHEANTALEIRIKVIVDRFETSLSHLSDRLTLLEHKDRQTKISQQIDSQYCMWIGLSYIIFLFSYVLFIICSTTQCNYLTIQLS